MGVGLKCWPGMELPYGPVVAMVSVTAVVPAPAAIAGGVKAQVVRSGKLLHVKFTVPVKVAAPAGAAEKLKTALSPASTVAALAPVSLYVTSVPTVRLAPCECVVVPSVP
jgi:hypothetical protein